MNSELAIEVSGLSKKFAKSLKRAMVYGLSDIGKASFPGGIRRAAAQTDLRPSEFYALQDVSFSIQKGERVGIIGPNGSGKSTLFSVLSGIYGPSAGSVKVAGRLQALIALGAGFHPMLSGRENVYINAAILGLNRKKVEGRIEDIIEFSGIGDFIDMPVKNYSSGMLVRLGFAIAANMDPDIMLIDEVLSVGDADFQSKCVGFSQRLADEGKTIVMVSHQLPQVLRICNRVIWLEKGHLIMDGPADQVVRNYSANSMQRTYASQKAPTDRGSVVTDGVDFQYEVVSTDHHEVEEVRHENGPNLPIVLSGHEMKVRVSYSLKQEISGQLSWWLHVKDAISGVRIFGTAGHEHGTLTDARRGVIEFVFPKLLLLDGVYNLDLGVTDFTRAGESHSVGAYCEREPSFFVVSSTESFREPFRLAADNRLPIVNAPSAVNVVSAES